jgi:NADH dehydrogenase
MTAQELHVVTGAFSYSGRHITSRLLERGVRVRTLTDHPDRPNPFGDRVEAAPFAFDDPTKLARALSGAKVLYNTYWVRFDHGTTSHSGAVANTMALFEAAASAGVERVVHVSITNPSLDSPLPYFKGKAQLEAALADSGLSHAILRPTVLFGGRDVLINNIAWLLRRFPLFGVPGRGEYGIQPIHVEDLARLAVEQGASRDDAIIDAVGPETFSYLELVRLVASAVGSKAPILSMPRWAILFASKVLSFWLRDVLLTADEVDGLMANLLVSSETPTGNVAFTEWLADHAEALGRKYASELARHYQRSGSREPELYPDK